MSPRQARGEAVRREFQHLVERAREGFHGLIRQSVDEVDVDGFETKRAQFLDDIPGFLARLNARHRFLHFRLEILHAD